MKRMVVLSFVISMGMAQANDAIGHIKLTNPVLHMMDGVRFALDGITIRNLLHVRREGRKIQFGVPNKESKTMDGKYAYQGSFYSIHQLAEIEAEIDAWYRQAVQELDERYMRYSDFSEQVKALDCRLHSDLSKELEEALLDARKAAHKESEVDVCMLKARKKVYKRYKKLEAEERASLHARYMVEPQAYQEALAVLREQYREKMAIMQSCLLEAREDFKRINEPYLDQVRGTKHLLLRLVAESCTKRKRYDSFLMKWAEVPEGGEFEAFDATVKTMQELNCFLTDLSNFFEDLIHSCPRGWKQYLELVKKQ